MTKYRLDNLKVGELFTLEPDEPILVFTPVKFIESRGTIKCRLVLERINGKIVVAPIQSFGEFSISKEVFLVKVTVW